MSAVRNLLRCPSCGSGLSEEADSLVCEAAAHHRYPIVEGVPRFVSSDNYAATFGRQWNRWSETQLDSRNGTTIFHDRFRRYICEPSLLTGKRVLDAGCGAGAFLDVIAPHAAEVVGFDLSAAVTAAKRNVGGLPNVEVVQADIYSPPLRESAFDAVICIGVIQHTPDPRAAFHSLARLVKPGGMLGVWIYERRPWEQLKPKRLVRVATRRLDPDRVMRFAERYAPPALRTRRWLKQRPGGQLLSKLVPVIDLEDYEGAPLNQLSPEQEREWTVMDTHDMLITWHEHPQTASTVAAWFHAADFVDVKRAKAEHVAMVGTRAR